MITIAYTTNRRNPRFEWFVDSLVRQCGCDPIELLVIDFYAAERDLAAYARSRGLNATSHAPKPTVWQGPHRLTKANYFAAANTRNTAICLAKHDYLVFADDLSVLTPTWYGRVKLAAAEGYVVCGSYAKVKNLVVEDGVIIHHEDHPAGRDARRLHQRSFGPCPSNWFYGCSCGAPIEAFLTINGYPEICDGMGYEDSVTGDALANAGFSIRFDPEMLTWESEEAHHEEPAFKREDPGKSPNDKSHALLNMCRGAKRFENYFGAIGIRGLRKLVQIGEPFPVVRIPEHEWFTGKRLSEL